MFPQQKQHASSPSRSNPELVPLPGDRFPVCWTAARMFAAITSSLHKCTCEAQNGALAIHTNWMTPAHPVPRDAL